jgi:dTDP-glucose pyrophosphorylase
VCGPRSASGTDLSAGATVILAAGAIDFRHLPVGTNLSNAMIPVNGRPVIGWILEDLTAKGIRSATVVLRREDRRLKEFLGWAFATRMDLRLAEVDGGGSILDSLAAGLSSSAPGAPVRVVLGDTLIRDGYEGDEDFVYVAAAEGARRWCLAVTDGDGRVLEYVDKAAGEGASGQALAGYYHLLDRTHVDESLAATRAAGGREMSAFLRRYGESRTVRARLASEWFDFGHIDNLVDARRRLLAPRSFNTLTVDPVLHTITKVSQNTEKLEDELTWYMELPERLRVLAPRIVSHRRRNGRLEIVQEYYGYPSLAELYVFGEMPSDFWASVLKRLFGILGEFRKHPGELSPVYVEDMYVGKTFRRLEQLRRSDPWWGSLLSRASVRFNGRDLPTPEALRGEISRACRRMAETAEVCVVHGDFCFSNILFDINTQVVRLIDPRGRFGVRGIHGDPRYDVAKLRHSVAGLYDYVVADLFALEEDGGEFVGRFFVSDDHSSTTRLFDALSASAGFDPADVRLIEGLLFLSMVPLHSDHPRRQKMMFVQGLEILAGCLVGPA